MRKFSFLFLCFAFFMSATFFITSLEAYAVTDRCPRHEIKTTLKAKRLKTKFQRSSMAGINEYLNTHSVAAFVDNPLDIETHYKFELKDIGYGRYCVRLQEVKAYYISAPLIVMPTDYKSNSCEYEIILKHEKRHLQVHYDYYDKSVPQYEAFLGRIARDVPIPPPVTTQEQVNQVQEAIQDYFADKFFTHVGESILEMRALQQKIDSPQEYLFTNRKIDRCKAKEDAEKSQNPKVFIDHKR
ncbi:MAG: hypothetical protein ACTHOO_04380 [Alcanivorax sp.]